jgi:hypothetical protein
MDAPFQITVNKEALEKTENYFEPLNITKERADELMEYVIECLTPGNPIAKDQVELFQAISKQAQTPEELVFISFKAGEYLGFIEQIAEPERGIELKRTLAMRGFINSLNQDN